MKSIFTIILTWLSVSVMAQEKEDSTLYKTGTVCFNFDQALQEPDKVLHINQRHQKLIAIPNGISKLNKLRVYTVMKNDITSLGNEICLVTTLTELQVRNNKLTFCLIALEI